MKDTSKKQNFLHGAALLALATAVVKLIGALYKLPLNRIIGAEGFAYFTTAYEIYFVFLMISTAGLPVAMSRMVSEASSLGRYNQVRRIYTTARTIFLALGIVSTLIMLLGSQWLAVKLHQPNAVVAIAALAPCAFFMCLISVYRGFFQGQSNMRPTSNSQMLEALFKLLVGLSAAFIIMYFTESIALAAGGAILGVTVSCLISAIYLRAKFAPAYKELPISDETPLSRRSTANGLLAIAIPITVGSAGLQLITVVESGLYMGRLVELVESNQYMSHLISPVYDAEQAASSLKGLFDMARTIFNMPCSFIVPLTVSVLPAITEFLTLKKDAQTRATAESGARITGLLSLPCTIGLFLLGEPIMRLLGGYTGTYLTIGGQLLSLMGVSVFLYSVIQYTNALLQAHGYVYVPVFNMLFSTIMRLIAVYILVGNPAIGILGVPIGIILGYGAIAALNLFFIHKLVAQKPRLLANLFRPLLPAVLMGIIVFACHYGLVALLGAGASSVILCFVPIALGAVVYFAGVVLFKTLRREDCLLLPKGEKIAKILGL